VKASGDAWDAVRYRASMSRLPPPCAPRIEIAVTCSPKAWKKGHAIRIAIAKAKEWADRHAARLGESRFG
jgi:hypothetical protein